MADYHERCLKCRWLAPKLNPPCGRLFKVAFLVSPIGGDITIDFTPGLVPEQLEEKFKHHLAKACEWLAAVIQADGLWDEIGELQKTDQAKKDCPGRDESSNPYLRIVRT